MNQNISKKEIVKNFLDETPKYIDYFVQHSMELSVQIISLLKKHKLTQRDLAIKLGKNESEISKWLSGNHNLTLKSIAKLEAIFEEQIIFTSKETFDKSADNISEKTGDLFSSLDNFNFSYLSDKTISLKVGNNNYVPAKISSKENANTPKIFPIFKKAS